MNSSTSADVVVFPPGCSMSMRSNRSSVHSAAMASGAAPESGPRAVTIIKEAAKLPRRGDYVFPGIEGAKLSNMAFLMLLRRMGKHCTAHGFRSAFRTWAAEKTNFPNQVCEWALAHGITDKTEASYNRTDQRDRRRKLMATWETFLSGGATVVQLKSRKAAS